MNIDDTKMSGAAIAVATLGVGLAAVGCGEISGEDGWERVESPADNVTIKSIEFYDDQRGWMAAEGGAGVPDAGAWYTDDGGESWEQIHEAYDAYYVGYDVPGQRAWMGGSDSRQLWYTDDSQSFNAQSDGFEQADTINGVHFWDDQTGIATTQTSDRLHRTTDGGENFEQYELQRENLTGTNAMDVEGDHIWLATGSAYTTDTTGGRVIHTDDRGERWNPIPFDDQAHQQDGGAIQAVHAIDETEIWVAGDSRQMYYTRDGMETWNQVEGIPESISNFYALDGHGDHLVATGSTTTAEDTFFFASEDGGDSWSMMEIDDEACMRACNVRGLEYVHDDLIYAYGPNNTLLRLEDF